MSEPRQTKDFVTAWKAVDESMETWPIPDGLDARVLGSGLTADRRWLWWLAFTAAVALWWVALGPSFAGSAPMEPNRSTGQALVAQGSSQDSSLSVRFAPARCRPTKLEPDLRLATGCTAIISSPSVTIRAQSTLHLRHTNYGVRLIEGDASFELPSVTEPASVVILVSGGHIEVMSTRFMVRQDRGGGEVSVQEGRITFVGSDGARSALLAGDKLNWRPTVRWPSERTAAQVRDIADLRARGLYSAAEARIRAVLRAPIDVDTAEVLSYERGTLLDGPLRRPSDACAHWRGHQGRFPGGRYDKVVAESLRRCPPQETR